MRKGVIMENFNEFKFTGNLVRKPWVGQTKPQNGKPRTVARFTVANNGIGGANFVGFTAYGLCAEGISQLEVGTPVGLIGHIRESSVKQEGKKDKDGKDVYINYRDLIVDRYTVFERGSDSGRSIDASADFGQQSMPMPAEPATPWN